MNKKHRKVCTTLNYIEHILIMTSTITGCISISTFASLLGIRIGIESPAIGLKICAIAAGIRKFRSIITKNRKRHNKIVLLGKSKINRIEVLISKALLDSTISHNEFVLINNLLKEYKEMKEEIKKIKFIEDFSLFTKQCYNIV